MNIPKISSSPRDSNRVVPLYQPPPPSLQDKANTFVKRVIHSVTETAEKVHDVILREPTAIADDEKSEDSIKLEHLGSSKVIDTRSHPRWSHKLDSIIKSRKRQSDSTKSQFGAPTPVSPTTENGSVVSTRSRQPPSLESPPSEALDGLDAQQPMNVIKDKRVRSVEISNSYHSKNETQNTRRSTMPSQTSAHRSGGSISSHKNNRRSSCTETEDRSASRDPDPMLNQKSRITSSLSKQRKTRLSTNTETGQADLKPDEFDDESANTSFHMSMNSNHNESCTDLSSELHNSSKSSLSSRRNGQAKLRHLARSNRDKSRLLDNRFSNMEKSRRGACDAGVEKRDRPIKSTVASRSPKIGPKHEYHSENVLEQKPKSISRTGSSTNESNLLEEQNSARSASCNEVKNLVKTRHRSSEASLRQKTRIHLKEADKKGLKSGEKTHDSVGRADRAPPKKYRSRSISPRKRNETNAKHEVGVPAPENKAQIHNASNRACNEHDPRKRSSDGKRRTHSVPPRKNVRS